MGNEKMVLCTEKKWGKKWLFFGVGKKNDYLGSGKKMVLSSK